MILRHLPIVLLAVLPACRADAPVEPGQAFQLMKPDSAAALKYPVRGSIVKISSWKDRLGTHTLLLTEAEIPDPENTEQYSSDDGEVAAYDYVDDGASAKLLWRTFDAERACPDDLIAEFVRPALTVTDLDGDGLGEVTMMYKLHCTTDYSPATLKLIMREGEAKYAIRGTTRLDERHHVPESGSGMMVVDPSFRHAPASFRKHAVRRWSMFNAHRIEGD
jgi:hypothetical protein